MLFTMSAFMVSEVYFMRAVVFICAIGTVWSTITLPCIVYTSTAITNELVGTTMGFISVVWRNF